MYSEHQDLSVDEMKTNMFLGHVIQGLMLWTVNFSSFVTGHLKMSIFKGAAVFLDPLTSRSLGPIVNAAIV